MSKRPGRKQRASPIPMDAGSVGTNASSDSIAENMDSAARQTKLTYDQWYARYRRRNAKKFELFRTYILAYHDGRIKADRLVRFMDRMHKKNGYYQQRDNLFMVALLADIKKVDVSVINQVFDSKKEDWVQGG